MKININKKRRLSLTDKDNLNGALFMVPWLIGFIFLFFIPMITSLVYSFNTVSFGNEGLELEYVGVKNYVDLFTTKKDFWESFLDVLKSLSYQVPVVVIFSMFLAILLNANIPGRLFFRSVFFLPLIFMSKGISDIVFSTGGTPAISGGGNSLLNFDFGASGFFTEMLAALGLGDEILTRFSSTINNIFSISWKSPIQIMLFIIGLQSIPDSYYEVCQIEGATKWETFWKMTFPMLSPITFLCVVYSMIDLLAADNGITYLISLTLRTFIHESMAIAWCYFIVAFLLVCIVIAVLSRWVKYMDD